MEAQQIRVNISELVSGIRDETFLDACYEAVEAIAKAYRKVAAGQPNGVAPKKKAPAKPAPRKESATAAAALPEEKPMPHDLSFVLLANEVFKDSKPLPKEAILAFDDALLESALKEPTLPNRL